jgi:hypothetical protein
VEVNKRPYAQNASSFVTTSTGTKSASEGSLALRALLKTNHIAGPVDPEQVNTVQLQLQGSTSPSVFGNGVAEGRFGQGAEPSQGVFSGLAWTAQSDT